MLFKIIMKVKVEVVIQENNDNLQFGRTSQKGRNIKNMYKLVIESHDLVLNLIKTYFTKNVLCVMLNNNVTQ